MTTEPNREAARAVARILLEIEAVHIRPAEPFTLTSGYKSPVYVDCRKVISFPRARREIIRRCVEQIHQAVGYESFDAIAGGETAGIPYAAWIADAMGLPMLYVRKKPKGFGRGARIEGAWSDGDRVLLVEDLATDGKSKISFVDALREAGMSCRHAQVVFFYSAFKGGLSALDDAGVTLHSLATWVDVLAAGRDAGLLSPADAAEVESFLADPAAWSAARGGASG